MTRNQRLKRSLAQKYEMLTSVMSTLELVEHMNDIPIFKHIRPDIIQWYKEQQEKKNKNYETKTN